MLEMRKFFAWINIRVFVIREIGYSLIYSKRKLNILFSIKDAFEQGIRSGFAFTNHKITFHEITFENIANYDLVIPLNISDIEYLNDLPGLMINNMIPLPSIASVNLCNDKYLFNKTLIDNGFKDVIPKMGQDHKYPYILKKKVDAWGENTHKIVSRLVEEQFSELLEDPDYFRQEAVPGGNEYATHVLVKNNKIVHSLNIEYIFDTELPIKGKDMVSYKKICPCPHLELFESILELIDFNGLCCFNYKEVDRRPYIIEINPRFGASLSPFFFSFIRHI